MTSITTNTLNNIMFNISNQINQYHLKIDSNNIIINNYDYFSTEYKIPNNKLVDIPYEYKVMLDLVKKMNKQKTVIDIGGNCGLFCIPVEKHGYTVYSFEPIKMNVDLLELNKKENNSNNLHIVPKAVTNKTGKRNIYIPYCADNTSFNQEVAISNMKKKDYIEETVDCIKFDSWINKNKKLDVGFIKIDVQGFEKEVLLHAEKQNADLIAIMNLNKPSILSAVITNPEEYLMTNEANIPILILNPERKVSSYSL